MTRPLRSDTDPAPRPARVPAAPSSAAGRPVVPARGQARGSAPTAGTARTAPAARTGPSARRPQAARPVAPTAASAATPADVTAFLDHYGTAFATADLVTVSRCYGPPVLVVSADSAITFRSHEEIVEGFRDVVLSHREWGLASLRHEVLDLDELTDGLVEATVRWTYHAARNRARFSDRYRYLLRTERGRGLRIQSVIVLDGGVTDDA